MRKHMAAGSWVLVGAACIGLVLPAHDATPAQVSAVEYHHEGLGRFFWTTLPAEMALLDSGTIPGWVRTWAEFKVDDAPGPGLAPVCRFFSDAFASRTSHFYSAFEDECGAVAANPRWTHEGTAFHARLPDTNGACPSGTTPVYRGYNMGQDGAPAHRLSPWTRDACDHFAPRCILEGLGWSGVAFCAPISPEPALERMWQLAGTSWEFSEVVDGVTTTRRVDFESRIARVTWDDAPGRPNLGGTPYVVPTSDGGASWDALAGKVVVTLFWVAPAYDYHMLYYFDFDGGLAITGCAYRGAWSFDMDDMRGRCHPLTGRRL
jgi:hypothetical protein